MWDNLPFFPTSASNFAVQIDWISIILTVLALFFTTIVFGLMVVFIVRYHHQSKASRAGATDHNLPMELAWMIIPLFLAIAIFAWGAKVYADFYRPGPPESLEIFVLGKQWMWHIQHPNGLRENNELHLPLGRPVKLTMIAQDVIHSFYVPAFRAKRDVIPGRYTNFWFTPTRLGKFRIYCAEYCGTQHSLMNGWVYVMTPSEYEAWLSRGAQAPGAAAGGAAGGEQIYQVMGCKQCHGPGAAAPQRCPPLVGVYGSKVRLQDGSTVLADDDYIRESILNPNAKVVAGYQANIMPPFEGQLSEDEVRQLILYIRSLGSTSPAGAAEEAAGSGQQAVGKAIGGQK